MTGQHDITSLTMSRSFLCGMGALVLFFGTLTAWSVLAPLATAAVASGRLKVDGNNRVVQHGDGGVVQDMNVAEGQLVEMGQVLIRLESSTILAERQAAQLDYISQRNRQARLIAQLAQVDRFQEADPFPDQAAHLEDQKRVILETERRILAWHGELVKSRRAVTRQRSAQMRERIVGLEARIRSTEQQVTLITEEVADAVTLFQKGLFPKARLNMLKRTQVSLRGDIESDRAQIAEARAAILESGIAFRDQVNDMQAVAAEELKQVQDAIIETEKDLIRLNKQFDDLEIRAPISGRVQNLRVFTVSGVIIAGEPILNIVPDQEKLVVEVHSNPLDIDVLASGLPAKIHLKPFNVKTTRPLDGTVLDVSADLVTPEDGSPPYYVTRVQIDSKPADLAEPIHLYPGMPADVTILAGERTIWSYLISPIADLWIRGLKES